RLVLDPRARQAPRLRGRHPPRSAPARGRGREAARRRAESPLERREVHGRGAHPPHRRRPRRRPRRHPGERHGARDRAGAPRGRVRHVPPAPSGGRTAQGRGPGARAGPPLRAPDGRRHHPRERRRAGRHLHRHASGGGGRSGRAGWPHCLRRAASLCRWRHACVAACAKRHATAHTSRLFRAEIQALPPRRGAARNMHVTGPHVYGGGRRGEEMRMRTWFGGTLLALIALGAAPRAYGFCGCDKPPPPLANVRPFVGYPDQTITLFDDRLVPGSQYTVQFTSRDGVSDWSRGKAVTKRDFADGQLRSQLPVAVPAVSLGPSRISVYDRNTLVYALGDDQFTVTSAPIVLHDFEETITRDDYQTGVGADGTVYLAFDLTAMTEATSYSGVAVGYPFRFEGRNVAIL